MALSLSTVEDLLEAATAVSHTLRDAGITHAVIGGTAGNLIGSRRTTKDVDIIVEPPVLEVKQAIMKNDSRFIETEGKFGFKNDRGIFLPIEILQHGDNNATFRLPDLSKAPIFNVNGVPILHPSVLLCQKVGRWGWMSDSTRPSSQVKANNDREDIVFLLHWLVEHKEKITFYEGLPEDKREKYRKGFQKLREKHRGTEEMLRLVFPDDSE